MGYLLIIPVLASLYDAPVVRPGGGAIDRLILGGTGEMPIGDDTGGVLPPGWIQLV
jgi:hypothetical protein